MASADKILAKMRRTSAGWGQADFEKLYEGFGFNKREGKKHTIYIHPDFPQLRDTVARHGSLANGYAASAVATIGELQRLRGQLP